MPEYLRWILEPNDVTPRLICLWIAASCEKPDPKANHLFLRRAQNKTWSQAEKMRAAMSFLYTHCLKMGKEPLQQGRDGVWGGNSVLTDEVATYMKSLRRRKVRVLSRKWQGVF